MRTRYYGPRDRSRLHRIPIYGGWFEVCLCHDIARARLQPERLKFYGPYEDDEDDIGVCSYDRGNFGVFFKRGEIDHGVIAHEVFHATHRIMERASHTIAPNCHEPHAHLDQYLTELVYADLKSWQEKIT